MMYMIYHHAIKNKLFFLYLTYFRVIFGFSCYFSNFTYYWSAVKEHNGGVAVAEAPSQDPPVFSSR